MENQYDLYKLQSCSFHTARVWSISWNHQGTLLASCSADKYINLWAATEKLLISICSVTDQHTRSIRHVSWSPCDRYIASASFDGTVVIWRVSYSGSQPEMISIAILEGHANEVKSVAWSPLGNLLATCGRDKSVWIWEFDDEEDFQCRSVMQSHTADVKSVFWHPNKEILGSTSYDDTINLYKEELDDWTVACKLLGHKSTVWKAQFSPSGEYLASCSSDKTIKLWTNVPIKMFHWICIKTLGGFHSSTIFDLTWSPCGNFMASCGADDTICVFHTKLLSPDSSCAELESGQHISSVNLWVRRQSAHKGDVNCVAWHPKGFTSLGIKKNAFLLASGGDDKNIILWSVPIDPDCLHCQSLHNLKIESDEYNVD